MRPPPSGWAGGDGEIGATLLSPHQAALRLARAQRYAADGWHKVAAHDGNKLSLW